MKQLTCIICPIACRITTDVLKGDFVYFGNKCPKGAHFIKTEMVSPVRSLTTTVRTVFSGMPALPVRSRGDVPKEMIYKIIYELSKILITREVKIGDTIVSDILETGCDIIATSNIKKKGTI